MGIKEGALALADELEAFEDGDCEECSLYGQPECKGHLSCMEIMARYAARKMREAVERDVEGATTVSAYDLLPEEDREALAWVRDHGGLEAVKASIHQGAIEHGCLLKVAEMLGTSIYDGTGNADSLLDKLEKRLMPEGMEWLLEVWPKWSNGEYCKFGDWWTSAKYGYYEPKQLRRLGFYTPEQLKEWEQDEGDNYGYEWNFMRPSNTNYRPDKAETPAFKVLAADGEPLDVGQTVWNVNNGMEFTVSRLPKPGEYQAVEVRYRNGSSTSFDPDQLTHQRPVLDEDGVPIKVGDTVWDIETGIEFEVTGIASAFEIRVKDESMKIGVWTTPCGFTHAKPEPPDSWERIEEDASLAPGDYIKKCGRKTDLYAYQEMPIDLVHRCRALAERGER